MKNSLGYMGYCNLNSNPITLVQKAKGLDRNSTAPFIKEKSYGVQNLLTTHP